MITNHIPRKTVKVPIRFMCQTEKWGEDSFIVNEK